MKSRRLFAVIALGIFLPGCAAPPPRPPQLSADFKSRAGEVKKIGVIIDSHVYLNDIAGEHPESAELSAASEKGMEASAVRELEGRGYAVTVLPICEDVRKLLGQYRRDPGATLPGVAAVAAKAGVDGIVIVAGMDNVLTPAMKVVLVAAAVPLLAILVPAVVVNGLEGPHGPPPSNADFTMVDKTGKILFYENTLLSLTDDEEIAQALAKFAGDLSAAKGNP